MSAALVLASGLAATLCVSLRRVLRVRRWPRVVGAVMRAQPAEVLGRGRRYEVVARYAVAQAEYVARVFTAESPGRRIPLFYDPGNPNDVVAGRPSFGWPALFALSFAAALTAWWRGA